MVDEQKNTVDELTVGSKNESCRTEDNTHRKPTRSFRIDYSQNRCYFLTICTKDKKCILSDIVEERTHNKNIAQLSRDGFMPVVKLTEIGMIVDKYVLSINNVADVFVDKYVIMPNHIHLILAVKNKDPFENTEKDKDYTSLAIRKANATVPHIFSTFKRFCNREIGENIFQRSYYDRVIRNIDDYNETVKYIYIILGVGF